MGEASNSLASHARGGGGKWVGKEKIHVHLVAPRYENLRSSQIQGNSSLLLMFCDKINILENDGKFTRPLCSALLPFSNPSPPSKKKLKNKNTPPPRGLLDRHII